MKDTLEQNIIRHLSDKSQGNNKSNKNMRESKECFHMLYIFLFL